MSRDTVPRRGWIAAALLALAGLMLSPPVVFVVNTERFVAGWPVTFLWAVGWAAVAVVVLAWAARTGAFSLTDDQVPPALRDREEALASEETADGTVAGSEGGEAP